MRIDCYNTYGLAAFAEFLGNLVSKGRFTCTGRARNTNYISMTRVSINLGHNFDRIVILIFYGSNAFSQCKTIMFQNFIDNIHCFTTPPCRN